MEFLTALTGTFDDAKPSLFELLSEAQLSALLPPSLRYLLVVATHRHPRYLLRILNSFDEIYAVFMLVVERHYLKTHGGGFVENFYGLKREKALPVGEIPRANIGAASQVRETLRLSSTDIYKNLSTMILLPYIKRKLDDSYALNAPRALLGSTYTRLPPNPSLKQRFLHYYRWFLSHIYPSVNAAYYFSILAFNLAYLFDNSKYHSPFLWLIGTRMRRLGVADYQAIDALSNPKSRSDGAAATNLGVTSLFSPQGAYERAMMGMKILLPTSIFALKFLEWWHASDFARQLGKKASEGIELPPPVLSFSTPTTSVFTNASGAPETQVNPPLALPSLRPIFTVPATPPTSETCPICEDEIRTPTVCQTGYVFCYACIHRWIAGQHEKQEAWMKGEGKEGRWESGEGRCAVTGKRVLGGVEGIRKIMV